MGNPSKPKHSVVTVPEPFSRIHYSTSPSILVNDSECGKSSHPKNQVVTMPDYLSVAIHLQRQNEQLKLRTGGDAIDQQTLPGVTQRVRNGVKEYKQAYGRSPPSSTQGVFCQGVGWNDGVVSLSWLFDEDFGTSIIGQFVMDHSLEIPTTQSSSD